MTVTTGDDTARLGYRRDDESETSRLARKALDLLPLTALAKALREMRPLTDPEVDALLSVEESFLSARALLIGLYTRDLITETSLRTATARWSSVLGGEAH